MLRERHPLHSKLVRARSSLFPRSGCSVVLQMLLAAGVLSTGPVFAEAGRAAPQETTPSKTAVLHVDRMGCDGCALGVRMVLEKVRGVRKAQVSQPKKRATVTYDPRQVTPQDLARRVTRSGYPAKVKVPGPAARKSPERSTKTSRPG